MSIVRILSKPIRTKKSSIDKGKEIVMNKETKLANLQKTSKAFAVIAKVIEIVNYVGAGICAVAIPVLFINQDKLRYFISDYEGERFFQMLSSNMEFKTAMAIFLVLLIIFLIAGAYIFRTIGKLFRNINQDYSPFTPENVKLIKYIAVLVSVVTLIGIGLIPAVMTFFLLWAVALLFDYGCELQTESDEIL